MRNKRPVLKFEFDDVAAGLFLQGRHSHECAHRLRLQVLRHNPNFLRLREPAGGVLHLHDGNHARHRLIRAILHGTADRDRFLVDLMREGGETKRLASVRSGRYHHLEIIVAHRQKFRRDGRGHRGNDEDDTGDGDADPDRAGVVRIAACKRQVDVEIVVLDGHELSLKQLAANGDSPQFLMYKKLGTVPIRG